MIPAHLVKKYIKFIAIPFAIILLIILGFGLKDFFTTNTYFEVNTTVTGFYLIFFSALSFILLILVLPYLTKKKTITEEDFKKKLELKQYNIFDITNDFSNYDSITKAYSATNKEFKIQFYILKDDESAKRFFINTQINLEQNKQNIIQETNINHSNYSKLIIKSHSDFRVVSRVSNTVMCIQVPKFATETAKEILKELGY